MPVDAMLLSAGVISVFVIFAVVLAWAIYKPDRSSLRCLRHDAAHSDSLLRSFVGSPPEGSFTPEEVERCARRQVPRCMIYPAANEFATRVGG
jgi:hypothetical protein